MKNYLNYINNNFNKDYDNSNYDAYEGYIRGNMFKNLYDPYIKNEPYDIRPMNEQAELITYIDSLCFAMIDLGLYLDVNPNDMEAIKLYNKYRKEKDEYTKKYESKYGPLTLDSDSLERYPWAWINMPWPWDN